MKRIKKTPDRKRNSWNCKRYAYHRFCKRGLEAKTARDCSHRLFLRGGRSEHIANRTSNRATRASKNNKTWYVWSRSGGQECDLFDRKYSKSFFRNVLPAAARSSFFKTWALRTREPWALEIVKKYEKIKCAELNLLQNGVIEKFWDALRLGIQPFLCFYHFCVLCLNDPNMTPKWLQSDPGVTPKVTP